MGDANIRAIGQVDDVHGAPLIIGIWHGHVNIDGRMLDPEQTEQLAQLIIRATREAARTDGGTDA
jgi:hypothetical protein